MTAEERQEIRERVEAAQSARPGEWRVFVTRWNSDGTPMTLYDVDCNRFLDDPDDMSERFSITDDMEPAVAEFIAHSKSDMIATLDALEATERELRLCRELLRRGVAQGDPGAGWAARVYLDPEYRGQFKASAHSYLAALRRELEEVDRG